MTTLKPLTVDGSGWLEVTWVNRTRLPDTEVQATEDTPAHTLPGDIIETQVWCESYHPTQIQTLREKAAEYETSLDAYESMLADWVASYVPAPVDLAAMRAALSAQLAGEYERRMQIIATGYPPSERESWPVQTGEARALLADPATATPWIDAAAAARGLDRLELAQRIVAKDDAYRVIHGTLTGARQALEDVIGAAGDDVQALQAIDVTAGWPR